MSLVSPAALTVFFSIEFGRDWLEIFMAIIASSLASLVLVAIIVPDSFAGEKERNTLSTLLASRLPDRAILFGKLMVSLGMGWTAALLVLMLGFVVVNIAHWEGSIAFYTPQIFYSSVVFSLLVSMLAASTGVLVSMRSSTVQEATQLLALAFMLPPVALGVVTTIFVSTSAPSRETIQDFFDALGSPLGLTIVTLVLIAANALLLWVVMSRFKRTRLVNR
jgi:ABC-2 type transport system permease protein